MRSIVRACLSLIAVPVVAGSAVPVAARAADPKHQEHMAHMPKSMAELMKMSPEECMNMMDAKHRGYVTKEEFMKFQEQLWSNMDKNRDNKADTSEWGGQPAPGGG